MASTSPADRASWPLRATTLRFLLLAGVLTFLALSIGPTLAQALIPLFKTEISWLDDSFRVDRLVLAQDGPDQVFRIEVGLNRAVAMNGHLAKPDARGQAQASTLIGNVTLPAVLTIALAMALPVRRKATYALRAIALIPALLLLWMVDVPMVLWAGVWGLIVQAFEPDRFSLLLIWEHFLHNGGRLVMAIAVGTAIGMLGSSPPRGVESP